ncbi:MAG: 2-phospho-L-lactate guanylyltransferase [Pseudorhodobacter sp.]|nr:2-phospho-L-lactate guanylyltransferase [Frankiaceae bacterium]
MAGSWAVVVPVKRLSEAKSRLAAYGGQGRRDPALAFALDVAAACLATATVSEVLVVTGDLEADEAMRDLGALVAAEEAYGGLNGALRRGSDLLRSSSPRRPVLALAGDLPCLRPAHLEQALAAVGEGRAFVADADGTGTTMLAAPAGRELAPLFGPGSRARHRHSGAVELDGAPALRRDVDTPNDLAAALLLGVGPSTAAAVLHL